MLSTFKNRIRRFAVMTALGGAALLVVPAIGCQEVMESFWEGYELGQAAFGGA